MIESIVRPPYHGDDSSGLAILSYSTIDVRKGLGRLQEVSQQRASNLAKGRIGIAHVGKLAEGSISRKNGQQTFRSLAITTVSSAEARLKFS